MSGLNRTDYELLQMIANLPVGVRSQMFELLQEMMNGSTQRGFSASGFTGPVTGNVTGDVAGNILSGNGLVTVLSPSEDGSLAQYSGSVTGGTTNPQALMLQYDTITESGDLSGYSFYELFKDDGALVCTLSNLDPGRFIVIAQTDTGTSGHTVTLPTGTTYDGTNDIATFDAYGETLVLFMITPLRYVILGNFGSVGLSAVP